jgi:hypothetical protein
MPDGARQRGWLRTRRRVRPDRAVEVERLGIQGSYGGAQVELDRDGPQGGVERVNVLSPVRAGVEEIVGRAASGDVEEVAVATFERGEVEVTDAGHGQPPRMVVSRRSRV